MEKRKNHFCNQFEKIPQKSCTLKYINNRLQYCGTSLVYPAGVRTIYQEIAQINECVPCLRLNMKIDDNIKNKQTTTAYFSFPPCSLRSFAPSLW